MAWADDAVFHSCYSRGIDTMNAGCHCLDLELKGRDEDGRRNTAWVRYRDAYENRRGT